MSTVEGAVFHQHFRMSNTILTILVYLMVIVAFQSDISSAAAIAKQRYYMDKSLDCVKVGILDLPRGQVTYVSVYSDARSNENLCTLKFTPEDSRDTLRMWFEGDPFIGTDNCEVSLMMSMTNNKDYKLGCFSKDFPVMEAVNGQGTLIFKRKHDSKTYRFTVGVQARRTQDEAGAGDSSTNDVGMIVGIIAAAIVSIVLLFVLCVCCYRKRKHDKDFEVQGTATKTNMAFENGKMKPELNDYQGGSPSSERRLLSKTSADYDVEDGSKPRSALDRFGPIAARRSDRPNERSQDFRERNVAIKQEDNDDPQRSPILDALRKNPKFRRSFHENEVDADDRAKRVSGSLDSSVSYNSNGVPLPPKLPPVPRSPQRSPSPQRKGEKIAGIFRARPSSSSSEIARQLEGDSVENGDDSPSEFVPSPPKEKKADTRHTLRPNREERKSRPDQRKRNDEDESDEDRRRKNKERDRRKKQEEDEEIEEDRRKKEHDRRRRQEEEEEDRRERKRREKERNLEDDRLEGRFKKSASGRRSKGKGTRKGRSKSTSNALEEMEDNYQRSRSKSPSSVRSLNFIEDEDDDDDLDSNYMPFKRAGSKTSLYASRSSLYGRRRKNSMGETVSLSSYAHDDLDSRYGDFDRRGLSKREKDKMFKSTGELEMHGATALVVRECATQTDSSKAVFIYGKKTLAKSRPGKMYSRGSQTGERRARRGSTGSARSGRSSRMKKSKSQESLRKQRRSRSRNLDDSYDSSDDRRSHRSKTRDLDDSYDSSDNRSRRSRSRNLDYSDDGQSGKKKKHHRSKSRGLEDDDDDRQSTKSKEKPRARPRKSTGAASVDLSDSDGGRSEAASSVAPSYVHPSQPNPYGAQYVPVMFPPQPGMTFLPTAPGGPPVVPGNPRQQHPSNVGPKPPLAPKPKKSKWDQLVEMTDGEKHRPRQRGDSPTESMLTSVYSHQPHGGIHQPNFYAPPSYTTAQKYPDPNSTISSAYPDSSGIPLSARGPHQYSYGPSESEI